MSCLENVSPIRGGVPTVADRRWGGKMQRMAQGGCAVRDARQNAGVNARKWGTLDEKRGTLSGNSRCSPLRTERGRRKARESGRKGRKRCEEIREKCAIWGGPTGGMRWANRESPARGENSCGAVAAQRKNSTIFAAPKPFPPNQHRWNSSSTNAESPWYDCSNR